MKKRIYVFLYILLCFACQKDPDTSKLDNDFPVLTNYDNRADFSSYATFYIADSVFVIDGTERGRYWTDTEAETILNRFIANMTSRGYTQVNNKDQADLGLQVSYIEDVNYFHSYYGYDDYWYDDYYWWWDYPGYWGPGYWGNYGGWYYPYRVTYYYNVGSLMAELIDLDSVEANGENSKLPVVWTAYMSGLISTSDKVNVQLAAQAVDQAFAQSAYIRK